MSTKRNKRIAETVKVFFDGLEDEHQIDCQDFVNINETKNKMIEAELCAWCGSYAETFKDKSSEKEYSLSGLCQKCQDKTFVEPTYAMDEIFDCEGA